MPALVRRAWNVSASSSKYSALLANSNVGGNPESSPFKGDASYYSVTTSAGQTVQDVIWTYEQPYPAVAAIAGHVAFYPNKAEISVLAQ